MKLNAGVGPVEAVDELSELAPLKEKAAELSALVVAGFETGFAAPRVKVGRGSVSAGEAVVSEVLGNPPKEKAEPALVAAAAAFVVDVVAVDDPARPEPNAGNVLSAVDTGSLVLSPKPPKLGTGRDLAETVFSLLSDAVRLNVTVLFFVVAPGVVLEASAVDVGDEIVPIENGVAVVEVTDDNVAESVLSFSVVVLLLRPNANPPLPES